MVVNEGWLLMNIRVVSIQNRGSTELAVKAFCSWSAMLTDSSSFSIQ